MRILWAINEFNLHIPNLFTDIFNESINIPQYLEIIILGNRNYYIKIIDSIPELVVVNENFLQQHIKIYPPTFLLLSGKFNLENIEVENKIDAICFNSYRKDVKNFSSIANYILYSSEEDNKICNFRLKDIIKCLDEDGLKFILKLGKKINNPVLVSTKTNNIELNSKDFS